MHVAGGHRREREQRLGGVLAHCRPVFLVSEIPGPVQLGLFPAEHQAGVEPSRRLGRVHGCVLLRGTPVPAPFGPIHWGDFVFFFFLFGGGRSLHCVSSLALQGPRVCGIVPAPICA
jgi:hypothetical protein